MQRTPVAVPPSKLEAARFGDDLVYCGNCGRLLLGEIVEHDSTADGPSAIARPRRDTTEDAHVYPERRRTGPTTPDNPVRAAAMHATREGADSGRQELEDERNIRHRRSCSSPVSGTPFVAP